MKRLALVMVLFMLTGCAHALDAAIVSANTAGQAADHAHRAIDTESRGAYGECERMDTRGEALQCVATVKRHYAPAWKAYRALRNVWLELVVLIQEAQADDAALPARSAVTLGKIAQAVVDLARVLVEVSR